VRQILIPSLQRADEPGMDASALDTLVTGDASAEAVAEASLAAAVQPSGDPSEYPVPLEIAASAAVGLAVIALGYASWASGASIPYLWGADLVVHEFGHFVTFWAPWRVTAAAGSFFQVAVPLSLAAYLLLGQHRPDIAALLTAWAGCSARNVAVYIGDAPYQRLALWGGDGVLHDWAQLLAGRPMQYAGAIAWTVDAGGWLLVAAGLALALAPVVTRLWSVWSARHSAAAFEARRASLPVREPHGPVG